jgi:hypothetical protein
MISVLCRSVGRGTRSSIGRWSRTWDQPSCRGHSPAVRGTLASLATDDEHHARLRETLLVFLQTGGSYKATAEQLMLHKNTVQYRIRKAEESLGRPVGDSRQNVELALQASRWLGSSVLRPGP